MNQQVGFNLLRGAEREFNVGAVHRIAGLEGDYLPPAHAGELRTHFGRSQSQITKVVVRGNLRTLQLSADVPRIRLVDGIISARMSAAGTGANCLGFGLAVSLPDFFHI